MKNIKKIAFYIIPIFLIQHPFLNAVGFRDEVKILIGGLNQVTDKMGTALNQASEKAGGTTIEAAKEFGSNAATTTANAGVEVTKTAAEAATKMSTQWAWIAGGLVCVYGITQTVSMTKDLYTYMHPDAEKKARLNEAQRKNRIYDAEDALLECLMKNAKKPRNDDGLPVACEDAASTFSLVAGTDQIDQITANFKRAYKVNSGN